MGAASSRRYGYGRPVYAYVRPSDSLVLCSGYPSTCCCTCSHIGSPRLVFCEPLYPGSSGRRRYHDPMHYFEGLTVNHHYPGSGDVYAPGILRPGGSGVGAGPGFGQYNFPYGPYGGWGGLGWKHPREWTAHDFEMMDQLVTQWRAWRRGRRELDRGDDFDDYDRRRGGGRYVRDMLNYLANDHNSRRLDGVENTMFGIPAERRDAAFRARLTRLFGDGGDRGEDYGYGHGYGDHDGGGDYDHREDTIPARLARQLRRQREQGDYFDHVVDGEQLSRDISRDIERNDERARENAWRNRYPGLRPIDEWTYR